MRHTRSTSPLFPHHCLDQFGFEMWPETAETFLPLQFLVPSERTTGWGHLRFRNLGPLAQAQEALGGRGTFRLGGPRAQRYPPPARPLLLRVVADRRVFPAAWLPPHGLLVPLTGPPRLPPPRHPSLCAQGHSSDLSTPPSAKTLFQMRSQPRVWEGVSTWTWRRTAGGCPRSQGRTREEQVGPGW